MIISARWFLDLANQVLKGLNDKTRASLDMFLLGAGDLPDWDVSFIQLAQHLAPEPLYPQALIRCCPYARPVSFKKKMANTARRGWLRKKKRGYVLTYRGHEIAQEMIKLSDRLFAKIEILPPPQMERLLMLLDKVVAKIEELPEPTEKPSFELSLRFERDSSAPLLARIRRRLIDLLAFYDDAHLAVRMPYETSGLLWETFTYIWQGDANTATSLAAQLAYRNYTEGDYENALEELAIRGWILPVDETHYFIQQQAAQMRQQVEKSTHRLFETAFADLNAAEAAAFKQLMTDFCKKIGASA